LDESCYREVTNSDLYVLIIGGRYGSEASSSKSRPTKDFFDRYESVTKKEYSGALARDIPTYILVERAVHAEYQTYQRNKENKEVRYAHVDSINIFRFIEEILSKPRNNPVQTFERHSEIQDWLRDQWSGLFKELLQRRSEQRQLTSLSAQVAELSEINVTLRRYLERLLELGDKKQSKKLIVTESKRLKDAKTLARLLQNPLIEFLERRGVQPEQAYDTLLSTSDAATFLKAVQPDLSPHFSGEVTVRREYESARKLLGLPQNGPKKRSPAPPEGESSTPQTPA
jgi:hypothetical protein